MNIEKFEKLKLFIHRQQDVIMAAVSADEKDLPWLAGCGTVGCMGGDVLMMEGLDPINSSLTKAASILGIEIYNSLFLITLWPQQFQERWLGRDLEDLYEDSEDIDWTNVDQISHDNGVTPTERKQIMIERIDYYMKHNL